jgi:hypothetical protein
MPLVAGTHIFLPLHLFSPNQSLLVLLYKCNEFSLPSRQALWHAMTEYNSSQSTKVLPCETPQPTAANPPARSPVMHSTTCLAFATPSPPSVTCMVAASGCTDPSPSMAPVDKAKAMLAASSSSAAPTTAGKLEPPVCRNLFAGMSSDFVARVSASCFTFATSI